MKITDEMVDRFLRWPLPKSVRPDACVMEPEYPHRIGTNLLTADEARQMLEYVLRDEPVEISPEACFTRVFHTNCPVAGRNGIMQMDRRHSMPIEDGSVLTLWTCLHCKRSCFAGIDAKRFVVTRPHETH